ncbi:MAG: hypothetical protein LBK46_03935 [Oscillospiraceae bacterium]|jgi:hypothetical protein|nr:hypothetical protein [Oscillospiraceae bacterium]
MIIVASRKKSTKSRDTQDRAPRVPINNVNNFAALKDAIENPAYAPPMLIYISADFEIEENLTLRPNVVTMLLPASPAPTRTLTRRVGLTGDIFTVPGGATLRLQNIIVDGNTILNGPIGTGTIVHLSGTNSALTLEDHAVLRNNWNRVSNGGAVNMTGTDSVLLMQTDAIIENNHARNGGAIAGANVIRSTKELINGIESLGEVNNGMDIQGGIYNNTADNSGGAIYVPHAALGKITATPTAAFSGNKAAWVKETHEAADDPAYASVASVTQWSTGTQGYNNWDIAYGTKPGGGGGGGGGNQGAMSMNGAKNQQVVWCTTTNFCECLNASK